MCVIPEITFGRGIGWVAARDTIRAGAGTQFDPAVVAAYETLGDDTFARLSAGVRSS